MSRERSRTAAKIEGNQWTALDGAERTCLRRILASWTNPVRKYSSPVELALSFSPCVDTCSLEADTLPTLIASNYCVSEICLMTAASGQIAGRGDSIGAQYSTI
jgi:hypothetical protein